MTSPISPEQYAALLTDIGLDAAEVHRATYAHCVFCGRQGYEHHARDCGAFTPAIDTEVTP